MGLRPTEDKKGLTGNTAGVSGPDMMLQLCGVQAHKIAALCLLSFFRKSLAYNGLALEEKGALRGSRPRIVIYPAAW
jgi:hypothetical protein